MVNFIIPKRKKEGFWSEGFFPFWPRKEPHLLGSILQKIFAQSFRATAILPVINPFFEKDLPGHFCSQLNLLSWPEKKGFINQ